MKTSSGLPLILHHGELYNYFIIYYNVINRNKVHNKCNVLESSLNDSPPPPSLWKNCLPLNWSLVSKRLGTAALWDFSGSPVVKTLCFPCRGHRFNGELRFHILAKKKKKKSLWLLYRTQDFLLFLSRLLYLLKPFWCSFWETYLNLLYVTCLYIHTHTHKHTYHEYT